MKDNIVEDAEQLINGYSEYKNKLVETRKEAVKNIFELKEIVEKIDALLKGEDSEVSVPKDKQKAKDEEPDSENSEFDDEQSEDEESTSEEEDTASKDAEKPVKKTTRRTKKKEESKEEFFDDLDSIPF